MEISNAACIVTGASRGIGRALGLALDAAGARVLACARDAAALEALAKESGGRIVVEAADLAEPAAAELVVARALTAFGRLDLVVNNAGLINSPGTVAELPLEQWEKLLEVNVLGVVSMMRAALPHIEEARGCIVNVSSYWGRVGAKRFGPYCASKFAVEGLSQAAAAETRNATVVALSPGMVQTAMLEVAMGGDTSGGASPEDCAERFVAFLRELDRSKNGKPCELLQPRSDPPEGIELSR